MQALSADLRALVLDALSFDRGGTVDDEADRARTMVDVLLGLALCSRVWTADAQARLRRTLIIGERTHLASALGAVAIGSSLETIVEMCRGGRWDASELDSLAEVIRRVGLREYIGAWPSADHDPLRCSALGRVSRLHLRSTWACLPVLSAVHWLRVDRWDGDPGTDPWTDSNASSLRHLDINAELYENADFDNDIGLGTLLHSSPDLQSLTLSAVTLAESLVALAPAAPRSLRRLQLRLLWVAYLDVAVSQSRSNELAAMLAPQLTMFRLETSHRKSWRAPSTRQCTSSAVADSSSRWQRRGRMRSRDRRRAGSSWSCVRVGASSWTRPAWSTAMARSRRLSRAFRPRARVARSILVRISRLTDADASQSIDDDRWS